MREFTDGGETYYGIVYRTDDNYTHSYLKNYTFAVYHGSSVISVINPANLTLRDATVTEYGSTHTYYYLDITGYQDIVDAMSETPNRLSIIDITGTQINRNINLQS